MKAKRTHKAFTFRSKIIIGASPTPDTEQQLRIEQGWASDIDVSMTVFEVEVDGNIRYCCWSGGALIPDPAGSGHPVPHLTPAGQGACEALLRLPYLYGPDGEFLHTLVFHGIAVGKTPLRDKVISAFRMSADVNAVICFVGDLAKELDGKMGVTFNVCGAVPIGEIAGMRRPGEPR
jgi:hypothetical protein